MQAAHQSHRLSPYLRDDETAVLAKGCNFSITPEHLPTEEIIVSMEAAIKTLSDVESTTSNLN